jgi:hypothetical protein
MLRDYSLAAFLNTPMTCLRNHGPGRAKIMVGILRDYFQQNSYPIETLKTSRYYHTLPQNCQILG